MKEVFLSNIELYFSDNINNNQIIINDDEAYHITKVMRHQVKDTIFVTDGKGIIFETQISSLKKDLIFLDIINKYLYFNKFENIFFCIPILKNNDRLEFAIEKLVELGVTNIIIYNAKRCVKNKINIERINKISKQALKQSLRAFLPKIEIVKSLDFINIDNNNVAIILEQNAEKSLQNINLSTNLKYYFIFGPEGGLDISDYNYLNNLEKYQITKNRLRAETAIITTASLINLKIEYA